MDEVHFVEIKVAFDQCHFLYIFDHFPNTLSFENEACSILFRV